MTKRTEVVFTMVAYGRGEAAENFRDGYFMQFFVGMLEAESGPLKIQVTRISVKPPRKKTK